MWIQIGGENGKQSISLHNTNYATNINNKKEPQLQPPRYRQLRFILAL